MRLICGLLMLFSFTRADERSDRLAIQRLIDALNEYLADPGQQPAAAPFTDDAGNEITRLSDLDRSLVPANKPWPEVTEPTIVIQAIRFITPDVALIEATNVQYGSIILVRRVPLLLVVKRETSGWRIAALRIVVEPINLR